MGTIFFRRSIWRKIPLHLRRKEIAVCQISQDERCNQIGDHHTQQAQSGIDQTDGQDDVSQAGGDHRLLGLHHQSFSDQQGGEIGIVQVEEGGERIDDPDDQRIPDE